MDQHDGRRLAVIGATGKTGPYVVKALCDAGYRVTAIGRQVLDVAGPRPVTYADLVQTCAAAVGPSPGPIPRATIPRSWPPWRQGRAPRQWPAPPGTRAWRLPRSTRSSSAHPGPRNRASAPGPTPRAWITPGPFRADSGTRLVGGRAGAASISWKHCKILQDKIFRDISQG